jgi:hypothetical protein
MENPNDPKDEELDFDEAEETEPDMEGVCHNCFKECKPGDTFCCPECAKEYDEDEDFDDEDLDDEDFDDEFDEEDEEDSEE